MEKLLSLMIACRFDSIIKDQKAIFNLKSWAFFIVDSA